MSEGLPSKPLQPARPLTQVHLSPGSAEEAIASLRAFGTSFPQAAGSQAAQTSTTLQLPTVPVTEQSQQPQTGAAPARKPRRRQPKKTQGQTSTPQLSLPQGSQEVHQPQTKAPPSQKARQPRKSLKRSIDSVDPSASQEGPAAKKPALQVSQPTQPEIQTLPSTAALQVSQQAQQSQTKALPSQKAKQPRKSLKRSIDSVEPSASQEGPATKKPALEVSQPAQPEVQEPPSTAALQASQSPQSGTQALASTIDLPPHQPAQQLQSQAPRTDPTPGGWWEIPGFSEAFKQYHRDKWGKEGTLRPFVVQGIINLAVAEHQRLHAAAAARQAAENQGAANPTAPEQETDPASAGVQALVNLSGGPSSEMGADNQQTAIDLPIDPQLQAEYDASSMDPRAHTLHVGGVRLSQVGLVPDPALPKDDVDGRFRMIEVELKNQIQPGSIPIPPPSNLPRGQAREFVGNTYVMPPGVKDARLEKVLAARNDVILEEKKKVNLVSNNASAKGTRNRREEKEINLKELAKKLQVQMNWWRLKAVSLGADPGGWNAVPEDLKETMFADMDEKACKAESAQLKHTKRIKGSEHSARNTEHARLMRLDTAKKEKEVQAIMAAIEAKDRERQEAQSRGQELPEMELDQFIKMTFPDDEAHADNTTAAGDTAEAPTPINDDQNDSIHANISGPINTNGVPIESTANIGESADAGGAIEHVNTTDVNNTMGVGNPINNNNISMAPGHTMDGNAQTIDEDALNTSNMASASAMDNRSLLPNDWAYQPYTQTDNVPHMSMDFQGAPLNDYGMQNNDMQNNDMLNNGMLNNDMLNNGMQDWVPGGTAMNTEFQGGALNDFNPQNNNFLNLGLQDNGLMQSNLQDTPFTIDDMQNINITTNGFQRITALDDSTQGNASVNYPMQDNTPLDTSLYGNVSFGNSTQCSTSLDHSVQGDVSFDTSASSNASIDSGTQNNASFDINFQDNTSVNYGLQGNLPTNNGIYGAAPYNNLIQDNAISSTNPQGNGNVTNKEKPCRVTKTTKPSRASKSNGRNVKKPETVRREVTGAHLPRVTNPVPSNSFNPAVLARARLDHIDPTDRDAFGGRPPSASQQILTPRACDFANDKHLTYENSFTSEGNKSLFEANYANYDLSPSDDERNQF
ncbi:hypothetical protein FPCIR_4863 [Fusarium pseudocircinatum]|uniref:Uncharacterized protein n=1 Tax=Fusarium pseudocircinatum TaxID=56676 RepID=A0A8H5PD83_9HYPO|nr:hypothetical protein FPCIR_4863 [Fusarium pseudocircinatum]